MDELEQWFNTEFNHLGLTLTPTIYDVVSFVPMKGVLYRYFENGINKTVKLRVNITSEIAQDLTHNGNTYLEYRELVRQRILSEMERITPTKNFLPKKEITKFKFK